MKRASHLSFVAKMKKILVRMQKILWRFHLSDLMAKEEIFFLCSSYKLVGMPTPSTEFGASLTDLTTFFTYINFLLFWFCFPV